MKFFVKQSITGLLVFSLMLLDILPVGEQMTVSVNTGCETHSGREVLRNNHIIFTLSQSNSSSCSAKQQKVALQLKDVLSSESKITIDSDKNLLLHCTPTLSW